MCMHVCLCACVRAGMRACMSECACVRASAHAQTNLSNLSKHEQTNSPVTMTVLPSMRFLLGQAAPHRMYSRSRKSTSRAPQTTAAKKMMGKTSSATSFSSSLFSSSSSTRSLSFIIPLSFPIVVGVTAGITWTSLRLRHTEEVGNSQS